MKSVCSFLCADDSDDDKEVSRKRTVRQAASKAASKQREILLGDGGSEDEEHEDQEEPFLDRTYTVNRQRHRVLFGHHARSHGFCLQLTSREAMKTSWLRTMMTATTAAPRRGARK